MILKNQIVGLIVTGCLGAIFPFIDYLVVIELFYLLLPFAIIFLVSLIYLIISFFSKDLKTKRAIYIFSILPLFILSQLIAGFTVDKFQRFRSELVIKKIDDIEKSIGTYPAEFKISGGIKYNQVNQHAYTIEYSRGFMVREIYTSEDRSWNSYGWND